MRPPNKKRFLLLAALLTVILVAMLATLSISGETPEDDAVIQVYSPFGLFSPGTIGALPGSAGTTMLEALGFNSTAEYQQYTLGLVNDLGVSWVRMDFIYDGWNFNEPAAYLSELHNNGIEVVGCVLPMNRFAPADLTSFNESFRQLVHKYPWIKVWQIGNEPDLAWDNPEDYPRFFRAGQQVVRQNCPDCRVALAGAGARWPGQDFEGWSKSLELYDRFIEDIVSQDPGDPAPFDIIDMHFYDFYRTDSGMLVTLRQYAALPRKHGLGSNIEFWITESATPTGPVSWPAGSPTQTEEQQATELVTRFVTMLGAQVKRVSWARFFENYRYLETEGGFFDHTGLIYNGIGAEAAEGIQPGTKKQGFYAYKLLIDKLNGCSQVNRLGDGKYLFYFTDEDRQPIYVLWDAGGTDPPDNLQGPVNVTDLAGNVIETHGESLTLGPSPIFVEQQ